MRRTTRDREALLPDTAAPVVLSAGVVALLVCSGTTQTAPAGCYFQGIPTQCHSETLVRTGGMLMFCTDDFSVNNALGGEDSSRPGQGCYLMACCCDTPECQPGQYLAGGCVPSVDRTDRNNTLTCADWGGTCSGGALAALADRTMDNQCGVCDPGYYRRDASVPPTCRPCTTACQDYQKIIGACGGNADTEQCVDWDDNCVGGSPLPALDRREDNECASCDGGFYLRANRCIRCPDPPVCPENQTPVGTCDASGSTLQCGDWTGACDNGALLLPATSRRQQNHCGTCNANHYLDDRVCADCLAFACDLPYQQREGSCSGTRAYTCANICTASETWLMGQHRCTACENIDCTDGGGALNQYQGPNCGYGLHGCVKYAGECENGALAEVTARRQVDQCGSCDAGFSLTTNLTCTSIPTSGPPNSDEQPSTEEDGSDRQTYVIITMGIVIVSCGICVIWRERKKRTPSEPEVEQSSATVLNLACPAAQPDYANGGRNVDYDAVHPAHRGSANDESSDYEPAQTLNPDYQPSLPERMYNREYAEINPTVAGVVPGHPDQQQHDTRHVAMHLSPTAGGGAQLGGGGQCSYKANTGQRCKNKTTPASAQCAVHTCRTAGCSKPKSSRAQGCSQHSQHSAGLGDAGSYATLRGEHQVYDQFYEPHGDSSA